jgi:very-short-patch-repair endonuclease
MRNKHQKEEAIQKIKENKIEYYKTHKSPRYDVIVSITTKQKQSNSRLEYYKNNKPFWLNKSASKEEYPNKGMRNKNHSKKAKIKMSISAISYIKNNCNGTVRIGRYEKQILDALQDRLGFSIKRQFYVNGYWLDGYCQELNLAIEIDEECHYPNNTLRNKDIKKQKNIIKILKCNFLRIRVKDVIQNQELNKEKIINYIK